MNTFCHYLSRLSTPVLRAQLALLCFQPDFPGGFPARQMELLEALGLVDRSAGKWRPTWSGYGVNNWHRHLEASLYLDTARNLPQPETGENGRDLGPPCNHFRELFFQRGTCWCARPAGLHSGYLPEAARQFLHWHNQKQRSRPALDARGSGQSLISLLAECSSVERVILQEVSVHSGPGVQLAELAGRTACLVDFPALEAAVRRLIHKGLLQLLPDLLPSWDGRGLVRFMAELARSRAEGKPLNEPFAGENGVERSGPACGDFRALLTEPELCWCGWPSSRHGVRGC